jgi:predicted  nucleic acid-binding Zn-ribbon protein
MVTIVNKTKEMQAFPKEHAVWCASCGKCGCHRFSKHVYEVVDGQERLAPREEKWRSPDTLYVPAPPYGRVEGLPDAAARLPAVKQAQAEKRIEVIVVPDPPAAPTPSAPPSFELEPGKVESPRKSKEK